MSHILEIKIDKKFGESHSIKCTEPDTADCRRWCDQPECLGMEGEGHDEHELITVPCSISEWFNWDTTASIEGYTGEPTDLKTAPIEVTACGEDGFEWHYADDSQMPLSGLDQAATA